MTNLVIHGEAEKGRGREILNFGSLIVQQQYIFLIACSLSSAFIKVVGSITARKDMV